MAVATLISACSSEPDIELVEPGVMLRMNLTFGISGAQASRADLGNQDDAEKPDGFEQPDGAFEEIRTLRIIILRGEGATREVEAARLVATSATGAPLNDNLEFKVKSNEMKTILLIANEASLPVPATVRDVASTTEYLDRFIKTGTAFGDDVMKIFDDWSIQVTGGNTMSTSIFSNIGSLPRLPLTEKFKVQTVQTVAKTKSDEDMNRSEEIQEVTLFLTRCAPKVTFEFKVDKDATNQPYLASGASVTGVRMSGLTGQQYIFPHDAKYSPSKYVGDKEGYPYFIPAIDDNGNMLTPEQTMMKRYITSFTPCERLSGKGTTFDFTDGFQPVEIKSYAGAAVPVRGPIYIPESMTPEGEQFKVAVQIDGGTWLEAQPLTDNILSVNGCDAIARNTHVKVVITFGTTGIYFNTEVLPYIGVELNPGFGFDDLKQAQRNPAD